MESLYLDDNLKLAPTHELSKARHAILGVPCDFTQTSRVGSRAAPLEIRKAFLELEKDWERVSFHDVGNLVPVLGDMKATCERESEVVSELMRDSGACLILLGGEHTVSYGAVAALEPSVVVQFDAHMDLKDEYLGQSFCHASVARRIHELGVDLVQLGVRSFSPDESEYAKDNGVSLIKSGGTKELAKKVGGKRVYVSVDLDVLDPSFAPGVGNPEPGGLSFNTLTSFIDTVKKRSDVVGLDLVEACPTYDTGLTCINAARIMLDFMTCDEGT